MSRRITLPPGVDRLRPDRALAEPELLWLPVRSLVLEDEYQRPLGSKNWLQIRRIAKAFTWAHFSPCITAPLGDRDHALIDGQHRAHAALLRGFDMVPCLSVDLTDRAARARAFAEINGQVTGMTPWVLFKAEVEAGVPWTREAFAAVEAAGCRLATYLRPVADREPGTVYSIAMVRQLVQSDRAEVLTRALAGVRRSRAGATPWAWSDDTLRPIVTLAKSRPSLSATRLTAFLDATNLDRLSVGVERMRQMPDYAGVTRKALFDQVLSAALDRYLAQPEVAA